MDRHWAGRFSVIVPSYNRPRQLLTCVRSLLRLWAPADGYEVILVDDGSAPPVVLPQEIGARVKLIRQSNQGPAAARNAGARCAQGRYLAFIDDDCEAEPDWLLAFERTCRNKPAPMLLGGTVRNVLVDNPAAIFNEKLCEAIVETPAEQGGFFPSNNWCLPRRAFDQLGGFRTVFATAAAEDRDFCMRWHAAGWQRRLIPDAVVRHHHGQTLRQFWQMHTRYGRGARLLVQVNSPETPTRLNPFTLAARTLTKTGAKGVPFYLLSQIATAFGYFSHGFSMAGGRRGGGDDV